MAFLGQRQIRVGAGENAAFLQRLKQENGHFAGKMVIADTRHSERRLPRTRAHADCPRTIRDTHQTLQQVRHVHPLLAGIDGFISIERFESLSQPGKLLSLSYWRDESAVQAWRNLESHRRFQEAGRKSLFADYRLRVAAVVRSYGMNDRGEVPDDSRRVHDR